MVFFSIEPYDVVHNFLTPEKELQSVKRLLSAFPHLFPVLDIVVSYCFSRCVSAIFLIMDAKCGMMLLTVVWLTNCVEVESFDSADAIEKPCVAP